MISVLVTNILRTMIWMTAVIRHAFTRIQVTVFRIYLGGGILKSKLLNVSCRESYRLKSCQSVNYLFNTKPAPCDARSRCPCGWAESTLIKVCVGRLGSAISHVSTDIIALPQVNSVFHFGDHFWVGSMVANLSPYRY